MRYIPPSEDEQVVVETKKEYVYVPKAGYIYIIHCVGFPYYKIGRSVNPKARIASLQIGIPFELQIEYAIAVKDMADVEYRVSRLYNSKCVRGEWYLLTDIELEEVKKELISLKDSVYVGKTYPAYVRQHPNCKGYKLEAKAR